MGGLGEKTSPGLSKRVVRILLTMLTEDTIAQMAETTPEEIRRISQDGSCFTYGQIIRIDDAMEEKLLPMLKEMKSRR